MSRENIDDLVKLLKHKKRRIDKRYRYYEMKQWVREFGNVLPPAYKYLSSAIGWSAKAVDALADRLSFYSFDNDFYGIGELFLENNQDILIDSAMLSALICSCSFIYIYKGEDGNVKMRVLDGGDATGYLDRSTYMLREGYAVLERNEKGAPTLEAYFSPGYVDYYVPGIDTPVLTEETGIDIPTLVPVIYRPDSKRPFGHSRISRACMDIQQGAMRTLKRSEISADFYSFPQRYILGTSQEAEPMDKWRATMSSFLEITKDSDGDKPVMGQFSQQSMAPYTEQMKMFASLFAAETGLTVDDLGFVSDNPSSSEAIKAAHENLRLTARKAQRDFSTGLLNAGFVGACLRDDYNYERYELFRTKTRWNPVFEPDFSALSSIGDGVIKLNQAIPGYMDRDNVRDLTGIEPGETEATTSALVETLVDTVEEVTEETEE